MDLKAIIICKSLKKFKFLLKVTHICQNLFIDCHSLISLDIHNIVSTIDICFFILYEFAMKMWLRLEDIHFIVAIIGQISQSSQKCNKFWSWFFYECSDLSSFKIHDKVTSIEISTFYGCKVLPNYSIPPKLQAFQKHYSKIMWLSDWWLSSIVIHDNIRDIG